MPYKPTPNFDNLLAVLRCEVPARPTLFEFFLNMPLYQRLAGDDFAPSGDEQLDNIAVRVAAFRNAGYDYATVPGSFWGFPKGERARANTVSINEGAVITDRASFEAYAWPSPDEFSYDMLEQFRTLLAGGQKLIVNGPGGVLENAIGLVGYERLCYLIADDPDMVAEIFERVGSGLVRHYELAVQFDTVGAAISNDDWGFKTQTMLSPADMRRYVFPWHKRIVEVCHAAGRPVILHSCGNYDQVIDDVIDDMAFDGRHSYEDSIRPVEQAYEELAGRIAVMGGIDVDFMTRATPEEIYNRSTALLDRSAKRGGFALGTGNSVPEYIPQENYLAMIRAATDRH